MYECLYKNVLNQHECISLKLFVYVYIHMNVHTHSFLNTGRQMNFALQF
jgi:hypothetical protein